LLARDHTQHLRLLGLPLATELDCGKSIKVLSRARFLKGSVERTAHGLAEVGFWECSSTWRQNLPL